MSIIIKKLKVFFAKKENKLFVGSPVEKKVIENAEKQLNVKFDKDYKEFMTYFGGSYVGFPIYAFNNCKMLSDETVVDLTLDFRKTYLANNRFPIIQESYVISISGNGDPIIIRPDGKIEIYYHDNDKKEILAESFILLLKTMID